MSIRCSGLASRSFIIGSRLWPPAMIRASGPSRCSDAIAPSTLRRPLVVEWRRGLHQALLSRLRGCPMSSRCSYCTGAPVPITGERDRAGASG